ncbi:MAG: CoA-binding protein [Alphaproteobacteria bacterium]|nr:CoA-binding protein [Alphaproteobacteria bacterium]
MAHQKTQRADLTPFLAPKSVAIVGLSRSALDDAVSVLTSLRDFGYGGRVYVINPSMGRVPERNVYPNLADVPEMPDLAVVSVARHLVPAVMRDCAAKGIRAAIVITQGFGDSDAEGARLQAEMLEIAQGAGIRIIGPNTIGVANALARFTSSFIEIHPDTAPVGQVAQSGLFMMGHHLINNEPGGFCTTIDLGNACDVSLVDVIEHFAAEPAVRVIQCHVERIDQGQEFLAAAERIGKQKPIVVLKAGRTQAGQAAVASHTGAAAGENQVYTAAFRRAGVVAVTGAEELRLVSKAFVTYPPPRGRRVAIMTFSGGGAVLAIDVLDSAGLSLAALSPATRAALEPLFPDWLAVENPVDCWIPLARDMHANYPRILEALLQDPGVDAVICIYCSYKLPKYAAYDCSSHLRAMAKKYPAKPILGWTYGLDVAGFTREVERDGTVMVFPTLDGLARSLASLAGWGEFRAAPMRTLSAPLPADAGSVRKALGAATAKGTTYLFAEALDILAAYGFSVAPWRLARNPDDLARAARELSFPLCLKVVSADIVHKSDAGGIRLGLCDSGQLGAADRDLRAEVARRVPGARIDGVLVQEMAPKGFEVMLGARRDPGFGPCVVMGAGGIYTEILDDYAFRLAPLVADEARAMIGETRIARLLAGARGGAAADVEGLVEALRRLSQLVTEHPQIREIDLNPLFVGTRGAVVADARIIL